MKHLRREEHGVGEECSDCVEDTTHTTPSEEWESEVKGKVFALVGKLDNGSHSSHQLQGIDESFMDIIRETRTAAVEEWIRENQPITDFTCSEHEYPIPDCLQCRKDEWKGGYEEGYEKGVRDSLEALPKEEEPSKRLNTFKEGFKAGWNLYSEHSVRAISTLLT